MYLVLLTSISCVAAADQLARTAFSASDNNVCLYSYNVPR